MLLPNLIFYLLSVRKFVTLSHVEQRTSGMMVLNAELKSMNRILAYVPGDLRCCRM